MQLRATTYRKPSLAKCTDFGDISCCSCVFIFGQRLMRHVIKMEALKSCFTLIISWQCIKHEEHLIIHCWYWSPLQRR